MDLDPVNLTGDQFLKALEKAEKSEDVEAVQVSLCNEWAENMGLVIFITCFFSESSSWKFKRS